MNSLVFTLLGLLAFVKAEQAAMLYDTYFLYYPSSQDCRMRTDTVQTILSEAALPSVSQSYCDEYLNSCQNEGELHTCVVDANCLPLAVPSIASSYVMFQQHNDSQCSSVGNLYIHFKLGDCIPTASHSIITDHPEYVKFSCDGDTVSANAFSDAQCENNTGVVELNATCHNNFKHSCPVTEPTEKPKKKRGTRTMTVILALVGSFAGLFVLASIYSFCK